MRVLGIDPGTRCLGYGIIDADGADLTFVISGTVKCADKTPMPERLKYIYSELVAIITRYQPQCAAIETPFMAENARSALTLGKAQAVAVLASANAGLEVYEYPPARIKSHVAGFGASAKDQIIRMVTLQLNLAQPPASPDAADALACALCHVQEVRIASAISGARS
ncbi:crossover junction endodeoxyribonuclease RuvC [Dehalogenimonas lykanthroporepellens BL-DC-9]|jgi:crossover junction endodeoxyribonuclease RuvC|nr:crossover junction endodeoxyribonuclease RuvC [Dehalogenimonas lykanthroporepellens BL-DC-9]